MQKPDKNFEEFIELLMKQQKEEEYKIRQEWSKMSVRGYNPLALRERTQQLLTSAFYNDGDGNKVPNSVIFTYNANRKNVNQDYDLQKFYLALPKPVHVPSNFHRMNQGWGSSAIVWFAAILIMGILVFLIRATEKCLERRLFQVVRRASEEWQTPSVMATSHQPGDPDLGSTLRVDIPAFQLDNQDLPPPYTDCTSNIPSNVEPKFLEEPPPPYAACFVTFSASKDGESVHIVNDVTQKAGTSRSDDNTHNLEINKDDVIDTDGRNISAMNDIESNMNVINNLRAPLA